MKKRWISLAALLVLLLVLMPTTAMAESGYCPTCQEWRSFDPVRFEYYDSNSHGIYYKCKTCETEARGYLESHTESKAATCESAAYCDVCQSYYGDPLQHQWSEWTKFSESQHSRTCQRSGCGKTEYEDHTGGGATCTTAGRCEACGASYKDPDYHRWDRWRPWDENQHMRFCMYDEEHKEYADHTGGGATCTTAVTCEVCKGSYTDPNNHVGPSTPSYNKISETQHEVTVTCEGCGKVSSKYNEDHIELYPASCIAPAKCERCMSHYGEMDLDGHVWSGWGPYDENQHRRFCMNDETHVEFADHTGGGATCTTLGTCEVGICNTSYKDPNNHEGPFTYTYKTILDPDNQISATEHEVTVTCVGCGQTVSTDIEEHSLENHDGKAATCTEKGWDAYVTCADCGYSTYQEIPELEHHFVVDAPVAPTCSKTGLTAGTHCDRCGEIGEAQEIVEKTEHTYDKGVVTKPTCCYEGYTTYTCKDCGFKYVTDKVKPLSHWYDLWKPAGNGKNSAPCKRPGCTYVKTTACANWDFMLVPAGAEKAEAFTICPVCGAMSDGGRLELVKTAVATPVTYWTPEGDLLVRCGTMENGETIMCVGFEFDARLVQCYGSTKFTVPAELLEGYRLMLLDEDGNETEVEVKVVGQKATFLVDYSADAQSRRTPVRMFHLVPLEPEVTEETTEAAETTGK